MDKHEVEVFLEAARMIGADASEKELVEIWVSTQDKKHVDGFLQGVGVTEQDMLVGICHFAIARGPRSAW